MNASSKPSFEEPNGKEHVKRAWRLGIWLYLGARCNSKEVWNVLYLTSGDNPKP